MRFQFTLRMASRAGASVHQVLGEIEEIKSIEELVHLINEYEFILVDEIYKDNDAAGRNGNFYSVGSLIINTNIIGKIKVHAP